MKFAFYLAVLGLSAGTAFGADPPKVRTAQVAAKVVPRLRSDPRSGQTVHTLSVAPRLVESRVIAPLEVGEDSAETGAPPLSNAEVRTMVAEAAKSYDVSPALVESVIQVESNFNPRAVSPKGARGLMQLMPETARRFGVTNSFDPKQNIDAGVRYLKFLQDKFQDDRLAIAAYNAGEGAVQQYGNVPPYPETLEYVARVGKRYGQARKAEAVKKTAAARVDEAPKGPEYRRLAQYIDADGKVYLTTQ